MSTNTPYPLLNRKQVVAKSYPIKILQYGDGNFLRAFIDWMIQEMNKTVAFNAGILMLKARKGAGQIPLFKSQDSLYTVCLNGIKKGAVLSNNVLIDAVQDTLSPYSDFSTYFEQAKNPDLRFVFSNTTEAGIVYTKTDQLTDTPQESFPGKLTALLYKRYQFFNGQADKGLIVIPCELVEDNGSQLQNIVLKHAKNWKLEENFIVWITTANVFCNTLVDRIVPGYPANRSAEITKALGYKDQLLVEGEQFHLLVIEGPDFVENEFPAKAADLNVIFTKNLQPYRTQKVKILNGAHTSLVPVGYLAGIDYVRQSVENKVVGEFLRQAMFQEICPTLDLPQAAVLDFANDVLDRFKNPFLEHKLLSISLNSISKYKTRVLPSVLDYLKNTGELPKRLTFSLAALIRFYKGDRNGVPIPLQDDSSVLTFFTEAWSTYAGTEESMFVLVTAVLSNTSFWGQDLTEVEGLAAQVTSYLFQIEKEGINNAILQF
ncbi:tagaturonate reductase [Cellulophaga sp. F20128]|uniref:tagaturonate reductase n=1 Tax=Cellulophaga sp. F20128 TaxID=2926413 RepID=UPI001FF3EF31|nr:tagaturonate reductase [Cellulophaga sp. F20128]MCK0157068.1 tagaturonate reductase [Cellulophaga sp. F20128]